MKPGAISLAETSGKPIIPLACSAERAWVFSSWDKMIFPKPLSKLVLVAGRPLYLSEDNKHKNLELIEAAINEVTKIADDYDFS
jgi:lysophospholipid acyltransferase (LPLAT)-like uncharacterized protein